MKGTIEAMIEMIAVEVAVSYATGFVGTIPTLMAYAVRFRNVFMVVLRSRRYGKMAYNTFMATIRNAIVFKLAGQDAATGVGETLGEKLLNPLLKVLTRGKNGLLLNFFTKTASGTIGETVA